MMEGEIMEDILKQILNKLDTMEGSIKELKEGQAKLEGKVTGLESKVTSIEGKIDKLTVKEEEHFNQVLNEIGYVFNDLENKIKAVDTKV